MRKYCIEGEYSRNDLISLANQIKADGIEVVYDMEDKSPASNSMTGYLSKNHLTAFINRDIASISIKNFGKQKSNDAMMAAFIEDLCQLSNKGIKIKISID